MVVREGGEVEVERIAEQQDWVHFRVTGDVSRLHAASGADWAFEPFGESVEDKHIVLDLRGATFLDSSGIGWLLDVDRKLKVRGRLLLLHSIPPIVERVLTMMRLDHVLTIVKDFEQAKRAIEQAKTDR